MISRHFSSLPYLRKVSRRMWLTLHPGLLPYLLVIAQVSNRVEIEVLTVVVVAHDRLWVPVAAHHLHLAVGQALVEGARDGRPSQVVRRELTDPAVIAPARDDVPDHPRREGLVELQRAVVGGRLKEMGVVPVAVQIAPARFIEFKILYDRRAHVVGQRQGPFPSPFDLELDDPAPVAPADVLSPERR